MTESPLKLDDWCVLCASSRGEAADRIVERSFGKGAREIEFGRPHHVFDYLRASGTGVDRAEEFQLYLRSEGHFGSFFLKEPRRGPDVITYGISH